MVDKIQPYTQKCGSSQRKGPHSFGSCANVPIFYLQVQRGVSNSPRLEANIQAKASITMLTQNWQVLIKVATSRNRRTTRCGFAFEARRMDGALLFRGGVSCGRPNQHLAAKEAQVEVLIKSTAMDLFRAIIVSNDQKRAELCNNHRKVTWQDQALAMDLQNLHQQGQSLICCQSLMQ